MLGSACTGVRPGCTVKSCNTARWYSTADTADASALVSASVVLLATVRMRRAVMFVIPPARYVMKHPVDRPAVVLPEICIAVRSAVIPGLAGGRVFASAR